MYPESFRVEITMIHPEKPIKKYVKEHTSFNLAVRDINTYKVPKGWKAIDWSIIQFDQLF